MTVLMHAPLACSLAVKIAAREGNVPLKTEYLNLRTKEFENGGSLYDINPLGQVSVLKLDDGTIITETATALIWIQSQSADKSFRHDPTEPSYFQLIRWISFCSTELHKQIFRTVFYNEATEEVKDRVRELAPKRFEVLDKHLSSQKYLLGEHFSAADAYLAWFFTLSSNAKLDSSGYQDLERYRENVLSMPTIQELLASDKVKDKEMNQQIIPE